MSITNIQAGLISAEDIVAASVPYEHQSKPQVYFLISGDKVVYVGKTLNLKFRLATHTNLGKQFDRVAAIDCESTEQMDSLEWHYIVKFDPPLNKMLPTVPGVVAVGTVRKKFRLRRKMIDKAIADGVVKPVGSERWGLWLTDMEAQTLAALKGVRQ